VPYCRELSKEPGVVRQIAWQLSDAATAGRSERPGSQSGVLPSWVRRKKQHRAQGAAPCRAVRSLRDRPHRYRVTYRLL